MPTTPPEIPYPFPPGRQEPEPRPAPVPPTVPVIVDREGSDAFERLLGQRRIVVRGRLDAANVTRLAAELMALDAESVRDIEVLVNSPGGPIPDVLGLLDVMSLVRARVLTTCFGHALGTAAAVVACGTGRRRATPNATLSLRCEEPEQATGTADQVAAQAELAAELRSRLATLLAAATGRPADDVAADLQSGRVLDSHEALAAGLVDEVAPAREGPSTAT